MSMTQPLVEMMRAGVQRRLDALNVERNPEWAWAAGYVRALEDVLRDLEALRVGPNPGGLCQCGCGQRTTIAKASWAGNGNVKDTPLRFIQGHGTRGTRFKCGPDYRVDPESGCWVWLKALQPNGYACGYEPETQTRAIAHRVYYERYRGPIPVGYELHHTCGRRACVNPDHLRCVTRAEHIPYHYPRCKK